MSGSAPLWDRLAAAGIVAGPVPEAATPTSDTPWYVSAMIGIAAWIASLLIVAFILIVIASASPSPKVLAVLGGIVCGISLFVMRVAGGSVFASQAALATSLAGQALLAGGILAGSGRHGVGSWLAVAAIEAGLVAVAPSYVHRVLTSFAAVVAVRVAMHHAGVSAWFPALAAAAVALAYEGLRRAAPREGAWAPALAGLALGALVVVPIPFGGIFGQLAEPSRAVATSGAVAMAAVLVATIARLLQVERVALSSGGAIAAMLAGAAVALAAHAVAGVAVALLVLLVAYASGRRALAGLAVVGMLAALSHHYYAMDASLLDKSASLALTGAALLAAGIGSYVARHRQGGTPHA